MPKHTPVSIPTIPLPRITVAVVPNSVAQLVIPGREREQYILAHKVCARVLELTTDETPSVGLPYIDRPRSGVCLAVRVEAGTDEEAAELVNLLAEAAVSVARDALGIATHRIERSR